MRDHSQHPRSAIARTNTDHARAGAKKSIPTRSSRMTTAVITRVRSTSSAGLDDRLPFLDLLAGAAEAALALAIGGHRGIEGRSVEVRPQRLGEVELRIRELPEEEVGDALLAAGVDGKVRLRRLAHGQEARQSLFRQHRHGILHAAP